MTDVFFPTLHTIFQFLSRTNMPELGRDAMILYVPLARPVMAMLWRDGTDCVVVAQKLLYCSTI